MSNILIIASSKIENYDFYKSLIKNFDIIICADGGVKHAKKLCIIPNYIIGDLDSASNKDLKNFPNAKIIKHEREKDETDLELALNLSKDFNAKRIKVIGALGGRIDHLLLNINAIKNFKIPITLIDETHEIFTIDKDIKIKGKKGETISFIPLKFPIKNFSTSGLKYPFTEKWFESGKFSVSNEFIENEVTIKIIEGKILVIKIFSQ